MNRLARIVKQWALKLTARNLTIDEICMLVHDTLANLKARRVGAAIRTRYAGLAEQGLLACWLSVQDLPTGSPIESLED